MLEINYSRGENAEKRKNNVQNIQKNLKKREFTFLGFKDRLRLRM